MNAEEWHQAYRQEQELHRQTRVQLRQTQDKLRAAEEQIADLTSDLKVYRAAIRAFKVDG